ncbi:MAG: nitroreductase [Deltaproteobacteria bacterium]|nr:nitroreductase [Deltaproteobacteria bacterium]
MHVDEAIRSRRTHKFFAGGAVDDATLRELVDLGRWAPNHRFTEPWRFYAVRHARLPAMKEAVLQSLDAMAKGGDAESMRKLEQKRDKIARRLDGTGAVLVVTWRRKPDDPAEDREDYAATACAVQNVLLGAAARGLVSLWSTGGVLMSPSMREFYGVGAGEDVAAIVFLGHPQARLEGRRYKSVDEVLRFV